MQVKVIIWKEPGQDETTIWLSDGDRRLANYSLEDAESLGAQLLQQWQANRKALGEDPDAEVPPICLMDGEREICALELEAAEALGSKILRQVEEARNPTPFAPPKATAA